MSTGGRKSGSSSNSTLHTSRANVDAAKKWVAEDTIAEAKEVFAQHTKETSSLDVLSRCKKLNELLNSDVLKGKGDPKAQLKEILGILHAGPKRPAFLDKPPVTATAGKRGTAPGSTQERSSVSTPPVPDAAQPSGAQRLRHQASDDVDDVIGLLNNKPSLPPSPKPDPKELERQRQEAAARKAAEANQKAQQEAEQKRKAQEEEAERHHAAAAAEALRVQRLRQKAALCIQSHWRGYCARRIAAQRAAAASVLQAAWHTRQVVRRYRERLRAACMLQCAVRTWRARQLLQHLRVEAFVRQRAARIIQRAYLAYRTRYTLGPLRVPARPSSRSGVDGAALLAKQLRLRSAVDARLAPECAVGNSGQEDDSARSHRTVVTHKERVRQVSANERNRRFDVSERAIMVASEHRETTEALAIARQGFGTSTPRTSSPPAVLVPPPAPDGALRDSSRRGSSGSMGSSRPGSQAANSAPAAAAAAAAAATTAAASAALRPPSGKRR